jgi:hypothetical protein
MKKCSRFVVSSIAWSILALPLGCSKGSAPATVVRQGEGAHIVTAAGHVATFLGLPENRHRTLKDTGELKDWAAKSNIPEDDLVSTRDHEPYQVHQLSKGAVTIITETTGVNGKKFMFTHRQGPGPPVGSEVTQEEIDKAIQAAPSKGLRGGGRPG